MTVSRNDAADRAWPTLDPAALYGLAGDLVRTLEPHTEADRAALLVTFLIAFGSAIGNGAHAAVGGAQHPARLFTAIVGDTAKSRKGMSWRDVRQVLAQADPAWASERVVNGLASGEGLIAHLQKHPGSALAIEEELARLLIVASRDGSTVSQVVRQCWDDTDLYVLTRKTPLAATGANVSILAHITLEELRARLSHGEIMNGFANRFLFVCARRSQRLPSGGNLDPESLDALTARVAEALQATRNVGTMHRSPTAERRWEQIYDELAEDDPGGMLGAATARAEAQVLRLSVAYALTDGSATIEVAHLAAACALWQYCRGSAAYVFGDASNDPLVERVVRLVVEGPSVRRGGEAEEGIDRTELHRRLGSHTRRADLDRAVEEATRAGRIHERRRPTGGRSARVLYPGPPPANEAKEAREGHDPSHNSLRSQRSQPSPSYDPSPEAASLEPGREERESNASSLLRAAQEGEARRAGPESDPGTHAHGA
jgi:Protein of unknown function (DUF3987)